MQQLKDNARQAAFTRRKAAWHANRDAGERAATHAMEVLPTEAAVVSAYLPIRTELDTAPLMSALSRAGRTLCVPVVVANAAPLQFARWTPETPLVPGNFGVMVPETPQWVVPDCLFVPMLAFDARGYRLGYGGGFYDRTLAALESVIAIGFAFAAQQVETVPTEVTDVPLHMVVTEIGLIRF